MGGNLCSFFSCNRYRFFSTMDDQAMHDEWRHGSGSTSSAGGKGSNPTNTSGPSVPYRGQRVAFPPEYFVPQESRGSDSQRARGRNGSRGRSGSTGRGGLEHGSGTSTGVQAPTEVGQERRGTRRPAESQSDSRGTSQSSGSKRHKARHRLSRDDQIAVRPECIVGGWSWHGLRIIL